jgi:hypothetical protein
MKVKHRLSLPEYRARQALHGGYEPRRARPDRDTTDRIMARLSLAFGEPETDIVRPIVANIRYTPAERAAVEQTVKQAIVVVVKAAWRAARNGTMLTDNVLFDAVAERWSPAYGRALETTPATSADEMAPATVEAARRDLICCGIRLAPLFALARRDVRDWYKPVRAADGWRVRPIEKPRSTSRLLLADDPPRKTLTRIHEYNRFAVVASEDVTAEIGYSPVVSGLRSLGVAYTLEQTRLQLHVGAAREELERLEAEEAKARAAFDAVRQPNRRVPWAVRVETKDHKTTVRITKNGWESAWTAEEIRALKALREAQGPVEALQPVVAALPASGMVTIKTQMRQSINRRWNATSFWPEHAAGSDSEQSVEYPETRYGDDPDDVDGPLTVKTLARGRLFSVATRNGRWEKIEKLAGVDVASSQWQILAILLGDSKLESKLQTRSAHEIAAAEVWPNDPDGAARAKPILVPGGYGSVPPEIAKNTGEGVEDVRAVLDTMGAHAERFRRYCRKLAWAVDEYRGFEFTDPFDGSPVVWHPIRRKQDSVDSDKVQLRTYVPIGKLNADGQAPVNRHKLQQQIAPMLVHALDSAFSGHVVEALHKVGVQNIVALFDCWLVAESDLGKLTQAVKDAGKPWLESLGSIYDALLSYTVKPKKDMQWMEGLALNWLKRVRASERGEIPWPTFPTKPVVLHTYE